MPFSLTTELSKLSPEKKKVAQQRIQNVHDIQRTMGMEPRDDSKLTYNYAISDEEDVSPSTIANELVIVDNLYKNTEYPNIIEEVLREIANFVKNKYRLTWNEAWDVTRFYGPTMLKLYCWNKAFNLQRQN